MKPKLSAAKPWQFCLGLLLASSGVCGDPNPDPDPNPNPNPKPDPGLEPPPLLGPAFSTGYWAANTYLRPPNFQNKPVIGRPPPPPDSHYTTTPSPSTLPWYWTSKTTPSVYPGEVLPVPESVNVEVPEDEPWDTIQPLVEQTESTTAAPETTTRSQTEWWQTTTTSSWWSYSSTTEKPWYQTTKKPWYQTEKPWYQTTENPWYQTQKPWYQTTEKPWYQTTEKPWYQTTEKPWYQTTEKPWYQTTSTTARPETPSTTSQGSHENYARPDGSYYTEYVDASGYPRIEQGYYKDVNGQRIFVKEGSYVIKYADGTTHRFSYIADENGYRTSDEII